MHPDCLRCRKAPEPICTRVFFCTESTRTYLHTCLFARSLLFCYQLVRAVSVKKQDYKVDLPSVKMSNPNWPNLRLPGTINLSPLLTPSHPNLGGQAGQGSGSPTLLGEYSPNSISPDSFSCESFQSSEELRGCFHSSDPYHTRDPSSHI